MGKHFYVPFKVNLPLKLMAGDAEKDLSYDYRAVTEAQIEADIVRISEFNNK
jgi:hypothetical protein